MNRLQRELHRLYAAQAAAGTGTGTDTDLGASDLIDAHGRVRAMVLELARPADWAALSKVWRGVQVDLDLPAPAIAVSGTDGYQLWFSLSEPVPAPQAMAFLESLHMFYLSDIKAQRLAMLPTLDAGSTLQVRHARTVPIELPASGLWSAFVAADLAPLFAETPWLDLPPNPDGQASLLSNLKSMQSADFQLAIDRLAPAELTADRTLDPQPPADSSQVAAAVPALTHSRSAPAGAWLNPKTFLQGVMNDDRVALALRIEAAKALLPHFDDLGRK